MLECALGNREGDGAGESAERGRGDGMRLMDDVVVSEQSFWSDEKWR